MNIRQHIQRGKMNDFYVSLQGIDILQGEDYIGNLIENKILLKIE